MALLNLHLLQDSLPVAAVPAEALCNPSHWLGSFPSHDVCTTVVFPKLLMKTLSALLTEKVNTIDHVGRFYRPTFRVQMLLMKGASFT